MSLGIIQYISSMADDLSAPIRRMKLHHDATQQLVSERFELKFYCLVVDVKGKMMINLCELITSSLLSSLSYLSSLLSFILAVKISGSTARNCLTSFCFSFPFC